MCTGCTLLHLYHAEEQSAVPDPTQTPVKGKSWGEAILLLPEAGPPPCFATSLCLVPAPLGLSGAWHSLAPELLSLSVGAGCLLDPSCYLDVLNPLVDAEEAAWGADVEEQHAAGFVEVALGDALVPGARGVTAVGLGQAHCPRAALLLVQ